MCVSHQITTESEEWRGEKMDNATHGDGDLKEHASVLFYYVTVYTLRVSVYFKCEL